MSNLRTAYALRFILSDLQKKKYARVKNAAENDFDKGEKWFGRY